MKKLNNKGITTIELLLCFILVMIITTSMYGTVMSYSQKSTIEQYKEQIYTYKNTLTKEIQDDLIKVGVTYVDHSQKKEGPTITNTLDFSLKDGTKRELVIEQTFGQSPQHFDGDPNVNDKFMIKYGTPPEDIIEYPIPDLGTSELGEGTNTRKIKDLSINNVDVKISDSNVLDLYIGFYHPELGTRYSIHIVCPIDYVSAGSDGTNKLGLY